MIYNILLLPFIPVIPGIDILNLTSFVLIGIIIIKIPEGILLNDFQINRINNLYDLISQNNETEHKIEDPVIVYLGQISKELKKIKTEDK